MRIAFLLILFFISSQLNAQQDTLKIEGGKKAFSSDFNDHSPGKAALFSLLPGGGQFYNKSYWKIPVIYAALFVTGDFVKKNHNLFKAYEAEAIQRFNNKDTVNFRDQSNDEILFYKDQYEYQRNLTILIMVGVYLLNIVDASVDAYFFEFDISKDVSLRAEPYIRPPDFNMTTPINVGLTLRLKL
jgi:hypothetical protein